MLKINTIKQIITPEIGTRLDSTRSQMPCFTPVTGRFDGWSGNHYGAHN
jgi:hypothetical protein